MAEEGVRHYKEWTPRLINRSRYEYEDESKETCNIMDKLGYGPVIRQRRIDAYKEFDRLRNAKLFHGENIFFTVGSKAEGLTCVCESDRDCLYALPCTVCLEDGVDDSIIPGHINVFKMDIQHCYIGYCRLILVRLAPLGHPAITNSLCDYRHDRSLMSSTYFVEYFENHMRGLGVNSHARTGPSLPQSRGPFKIDVVSAIRCNYPGILQKWASRARLWPPPDIVEKVIAMGAFVCPKGYKGSEHNHVEWRICFNTAETELVNNLNDTQAKIYVILKMIVNDVLKPQSKEITSYTLKNIVLWLAENNPQTSFHSGSLFHWLHEGLDTLRTAISDSELPYYMIPERNLMAERGLGVEQQALWVRSITDIMNDGPKILLRLNKIRQAIVGYPEPLLWYSKMRTELEMLHFENNNRRVQCSNKKGDEINTIVLALDKRMIDIIVVILIRMQLEGSSVNDENYEDKVLEMMLS